MEFWDKSNKIRSHSFLRNTDVVQVPLYPVVPAVVEVLIEVVDPIPHHALPGELPLALIEFIFLGIHGGDLPVVAEGHSLT